MLKTYLYVPDELNKELTMLAKGLVKSKAEVMRNALKEGVKHLKRKKVSSVGALLEVAEIGRKYKAKGPSDLSINMDKYLWEDYEA